MCQHAASIVDTAVQKLSAFLSKVLNNTLGDSKLFFPYSPVQFFPLALPHQSQMLKPLFLCQLHAQIIQFKCWVVFFFLPNGRCSLSKRWRNRGIEILPRSCKKKWTSGARSLSSWFIPSVSDELLEWAEKSHPPCPGPAKRTLVDSQPYLDF